MSTTRLLEVALVLAVTGLLAAEIRRRDPLPAAPPPSPGTGQPLAAATEGSRMERSPELDRALAVGRTFRSGRDGLEVTERVVRYPIQGRTPEELYAAMDSLGPLVDGSRHFAMTNVRAEPRPDPGDGVVCDPAATTLRVVLTVTLPEWRPPPSAPPALRERWRRFVRGLELHERDHMDLGLYYADAMLREARSVRATACPELHRTIEAQKGAAGAHERVQRRYDEETRALLRRPPSRL